MRTASRWITSLLITGLVVLVGFVGLGATGQFGLENPFRTETTDRSQPALLKSIQDISQYHAAVGNFEVVLDVERDVKFLPSFIAGKRSLFVAAGTVDAYVDFSGLSGQNLIMSKDGKSVEIRLPEAELDKPNLDPDRTYMFSEDRGAFDRVSDALSGDDQSDLYKLAEEKLVSAAEESELAHQADENTRAMLIGLCASLDIKVTFIDEPREE